MLVSSMSSQSLPSMPGIMQQDPAAPVVHVSLSKPAYRPGDTVCAIIDVDNFRGLYPGDEGRDWLDDGFASDRWQPQEAQVSDGLGEAVLVEDLVVELKGLERLDPSWIQVPKVPAGSNQPRGERTIVETLPWSIAKDVVMEHGTSCTYSVRVTLPKVLPPSYRGTAVRYHYYVAVQCKWSPVVGTAGASLEGDGAKQANARAVPQPQEVRVPFRVWTYPHNSGLNEEEIGAEDHYGIGGIVPTAPLKVEIRWREKTARARWVANAEATSGAEDEELTHQDETAAQSNLYGRQEHRMVDRVLSMPGHRFPSSSPMPTAATATVTEVDEVPPTEEGEEGEDGYRAALGRGSGALGSGPEGLADGAENERLERVRCTSLPSGANGRGTMLYGEFESLLLNERSKVAPQERESWQGSSLLEEPESPLEAPPRGPFGNGSVLASREDMEDNAPPSPSAPINVRARTYNIRIDDQVLVKFTPRNPTSTYSLGDVVSGTLAFSQDPGARECLAVSVLLETHEVVNPLVLHPSRKAVGLRENSNAPLHLPAIQTEFHEVTADLLSTHFLFTIPMDTPASFATPLVSLQWILRFEFISSAKRRGVSGGGFRQGEGILGGEATERGEWSMPITVTAPLPRSHPAGVTGQVAFSNLRRERSTFSNLGKLGMRRTTPHGRKSQDRLEPPPVLASPPLASILTNNNLKGSESDETPVNRALRFGSPSRSSSASELDPTEA